MPVEAREAATPSPDMRLGFDDRTAVMMQRLNIWKDELVAWFKTLASAAVVIAALYMAKSLLVH